MTSVRAKVLLILTNLVSVVCLVWVLRGANLENLGAEIRAMHWGWVAFAVISDIFVYFLQGWRWSILLEPVAKVPVMRSVRAIYVGLFANEVLPFRSGEVIRCYLQARWGKLPLGVTLSSALIERVFDGIWLVLYLAVVVQFVDVPRHVRNGGYAMLLIITAIAGLLVWVMFYKQHAKAAASQSRWKERLEVIVDDLHAIGSSRSFYFAWLASLPHLLSMTLPIYGAMRAYGLDELDIWDAAIINILVRLGTVIPAAPGNLGTYQAATVVALTLLGVAGAQAKRFSLVLWGIITVPLLIAGFIALSVTGFKIKELLKRAEHEASTTKV